MKKVMLLCLAIFYMAAAHAQNNKVISAFNYNNDGYLDKAKKNIDEACKHETTMTKAKTWKYRGDIYMNIQYTKDPKYKALSTDAIGEAYSSYLKAIEFDTKKEYEEEIANAMGQIRAEFFNKGVAKFQEKNYAEAAELFTKSGKIFEKVGKFDTLSLYYATMNYEMTIQDLVVVKKDTNNPNLEAYFKNAIEGYSKLINVDYKQPAIYGSLVGLYLQKKQNDKAMEIVQVGRGKYPKEYSIVVAEANVYLATNQNQKALEALNVAVSMDPKNPVLYYAIGNKLEAVGEITKAEEYYRKAIELKSDYVDAIYCLGAMFFNEGVKLFQAADKLDPMSSEYSTEKEKFDGLWNKAVPLLEQALNFSPNDMNTLLALKQLYSRLSMTDKYDIVNQKIKELQKK